MRHSHALLLLALACAPAFAQDETATPPPSGWTGTGELGFALARGNARSENLNAKLAFGKETQQWKHDWYAQALRAKGEVSGDFDGDGVSEERYELNANRYELGASSGYKFDPRNAIVGTLRYENDDFSPYEYQATASINYGRIFVDGERTRFSGEIGPGYRRARSLETGGIESDAIVRGKLDFAHKLTANTELFNVLLVESGSDNTFAQNDLGVAVAMNEAFALKAGLQARHNTDVDAAAGVKKTDTLTTLNLVYRFR
ncbi:MAG: DUF481 domain-containing protein [Luteimonas sp.]|nr:DUF481 domain-containing protein [Luteimonas sp.]